MEEGSNKSTSFVVTPEGSPSYGHVGTMPLDGLGYIKKHCKVKTIRQSLECLKMVLEKDFKIDKVKFLSKLTLVCRFMGMSVFGLSL
jgi:hypothetical protein